MVLRVHGRRAMKRLACFTTLFLATSTLAHADTTTAVVVGVPVSALSGLTFTTIDLVKAPKAKLYGISELAVGGGLAVVSGYLAATVDAPRTDSNWANWTLGGLAVWNLGVAVHGVYVLAKGPAENPTAVKIGGVRGVVAPTLVGDATESGAGLMMAGSF